MKDRILQIRENVLKRYIGVFCESKDENEAVSCFRQAIGLDDTYESSYKIKDYSKDIVIKFTDGKNVIEITLYAEVGTAISYSISVNNVKTSIRMENDDIANALKICKNDRVLTDDLAKVKKSLEQEEKPTS